MEEVEEGGRQHLCQHQGQEQRQEHSFHVLETKGGKGQHLINYNFKFTEKNS
jgi:hypothetical protein